MADGEVTRLLAELRAGDDQALERLLPIVYAELRTVAANLLRGERVGHTLQPTALVHEAYVRLLGEKAPPLDRQHFFAVAARAMRRVLIDHARARGRQKRGGGAVPVTLHDDVAAAVESDPIDLLALDEAMQKLESADPRRVRVVELMYFGGLSASETAEVVGVTRRTVERDWQYARAWLLREMTA